MRESRRLHDNVNEKRAVSGLYRQGRGQDFPWTTGWLPEVRISLKSKFDIVKLL